MDGPGARLHFLPVLLREPGGTPGSRWVRTLGDCCPSPAHPEPEGCLHAPAESGDPQLQGARLGGAVGRSFSRPREGRGAGPRGPERVSGLTLPDLPTSEAWLCWEFVHSDLRHLVAATLTAPPPLPAPGIPLQSLQEAERSLVGTPGGGLSALQPRGVFEFNEESHLCCETLPVCCFGDWIQECSS